MSETPNTPTSIDDGIPEVSFTLEVSNTNQAPVDDTLSISGMAADAKATGEKIAEEKAAVEAELATAAQTLQNQINSIDADIGAIYGNLYPVGSIYTSTSAQPPTFGGANWNWQEIKIPVTQGDLMDGVRNFAPIGSTPPGTIHYWLRVADTEEGE